MGTSNTRPWRAAPAAIAALLACVAVGQAGADPVAAAHDAAGAVALRYRLAPGQVWHSTQTIERRTTFGELVESDTGVARLEYRVGETDAEGRVTLEATMLSQSTSSGQSPFDFSVITFRARLGPRGPATGAWFEIGEAEPPELPDVPRDQVAFRTMLRTLASAWLESVFWFPELPEAPLELGASFSIDESESVPTAEPGVSMQQTSVRTYTLREVEGDRARFEVTDASQIETETAVSELEAIRAARGEASFDLVLGSWVKTRLRSTHRATWAGAQGIGDGVSTAETVTTIEMAPAK